MPDYHFSVGNSTTGPIGFCAAVTASSRDDAVRILREHLDSCNCELEIPGTGDDPITVYFNPNAVTVDDIDDDDEPTVEEAQVPIDQAIVDAMHRTMNQ